MYQPLPKVFHLQHDGFESKLFEDFISGDNWKMLLYYCQRACVELRPFYFMEGGAEPFRSRDALSTMQGLPLNATPTHCSADARRTIPSRMW